MKHVLKFIYVSLFIVIGVACSNVTNDLEKAELIAESAPDSAMSILNNYEYNSINDDQKALFGLIFIQLHDKKNLEIVHSKILNTSTEYYEKKNDKKHLTFCYFYTGRMFKYRLQYDKAMTFYLKALDCCSSKDYFILGRINSDIGDVFTFQGNNKEAISKYQLSHDYFAKARNNIFAHYALIYIGKSFTYLKMYNNAQTKFNEVISSSKDSIVLGFAYLNAGINQYQAGKYRIACNFIKNSFNYPQIAARRPFQNLYLAESYFELGSNDSAKIFATSTLKLNPDIVVKRDCYRILANVAYNENNTLEFKKCLSLYQDYSDSIRNIYNQPKGKELEQIFLSEKKASSSQARIWFLVISIVLICITSIWLYHKIAKVNNKKIKDIEFKSIQEKKETIQDIINRKKETLHNLIKEKKETINLKGKLKSGMSMNELLMLYYDEYIHLSNPAYFKKEMNATLNGLYSKLENTYPDLREIEIQWACLSLLRFPNDEIMILLDYNSEAFKKMKQRFARKINASSVANIDLILHELMYRM